MQFFLQLLFGGLATGFVYAIIAIGYVIIYRSSKVLNFAHGALVMLGAYITFTLCRQFNLKGVLLILGISLVMVIFNYVLARGVIRPLIGKPVLSVVMVTLGISSIIMGGTVLIWGGAEKVLTDIGLPQFNISFLSVTIASKYSLAAVFSLVLIALIIVFFRVSKQGLSMRAAAEDQYGALCLGVSISKVYELSWVIAGVIAAMGGLVLGNISLISLAMPNIGYKVFAVIILGGLDSIPGALLGGVIVGVVESLAGGYLDPIIGGGFGDTMPFIMLLLILLTKPYGLFGTEEEIMRV